MFFIDKKILHASASFSKDLIQYCDANTIALVFIGHELKVLGWEMLLKRYLVNISQIRFIFFLRLQRKNLFLFSGY